VLPGPGAVIPLNAEQLTDYLLVFSSKVTGLRHPTEVLDSKIAHQPPSSSSVPKYASRSSGVIDASMASS
jgi:hypothetical protein